MKEKDGNNHSSLCERVCISWPHKGHWLVKWRSRCGLLPKLLEGPVLALGCKQRAKWSFFFFFFLEITECQKVAERDPLSLRLVSDGRLYYAGVCGVCCSVMPAHGAAPASWRGWCTKPPLRVATAALHSTSPLDCRAFYILTCP